MSYSTRIYNIVILSIIVFNLSSQQNESSAFTTTRTSTSTTKNNNSYYSRANQLSFSSTSPQFFPVDKLTNQNRMRQETRIISPGPRRRGARVQELDVMKISFSSSSSSSSDEDGDNNDDDLKSRGGSSSSSSSLLSFNNLWGKDPRNRSVFGVLTASFLSLLGFTMVSGPLTPALGKHFQLEVGSLFGALTSAYPLGMMVGIFIWPSLSDKVGRRNVLSFSLLGSGLGLMAQALVILRGGTLTQFLLTRTLTGFFAGSSPVSKAYLADIGAKDGKLPRYLSLKDASATLAFIMGPAAGGLLFEFRRKMIGASTGLSKADLLDTSGSLAFVIAISAAASMLASIIARVLVKESSFYKNKTSEHEQEKKDNYDDEIAAVEKGEDEEELISCPLGQSLWAGVASVCLVSFFFNVGDSTFHA